MRSTLPAVDTFDSAVEILRRSAPYLSKFAGDRRAERKLAVFKESTAEIDGWDVRVYFSLHELGDSTLEVLRISNRQSTFLPFRVAIAAGRRAFPEGLLAHHAQHEGDHKVYAWMRSLDADGRPDLAIAELCHPDIRTYQGFEYVALNPDLVDFY